MTVDTRSSIDGAVTVSTTSAAPDVEYGRACGADTAQNENSTPVRMTLLARLQACVSGNAPRTGFDTTADTGPKERVRIIRNQPPGYSKLAAFMDSDPSFMVYRRFGYVRQRLLLYWQDVLREREKELDELDRSDDADALRMQVAWNRERDDSQNPPRRRLLMYKLGDALREYDAVLLRTVKLYDFEAPSVYSRTDVENVIHNDNALKPNDRSFIEHADDLVALASDKERTRVHQIFENIFFGANKPFSRRVFRTKVQQVKIEGSDLELELYSTERMNRVVTSFFVLVIVALLMIPTFTLYWMESSKASGFSMNAAILGFTSAFALMLTTCTSAKRHEIFGATAAYCAVLVVFIGQGPSNGPS